MTPRRLWLSSALLLLAPALVGLSAEKDLYGDPLPEGAKARMGTARLRNFGYSTPLMAPDGKAFIASSNAGVVRIDPATGATLGKLTSPFYATPNLVSADGKRLVNVLYDRVVVWEAESGKTIAKVDRRAPSSDNSAALSLDGKTLAVGGVGDRVKKAPVVVTLWDVDGNKELKTITVPQNESASVAISGDAKTLATWGYHFNPDAKAAATDDDLNRFVHFWDATTGKQLGKARTSGYALGAVAFNPAGTVAAVAGGDGAIGLVDPKTGAEKHLLLGRTRMGRTLAFSPDGATLAATGDDGSVQRWRVADGTRLSTTEPPAADAHSARVRVLDNDKAVAWGMRGLAVVVWEVPSGKLISAEGGHTSSVRAVAVTPDNKHVLTSSDDGTATRWELATGKPVGPVPIRVGSGSFAASVPVLAFSADAGKALVRDNLGGLGVHDVAAGTQLYAIPTPRDTKTAGAFSADGTKVVQSSSSYDHKKVPARVAVWDATAGKRLGGVELPGYSEVTGAVTPDGKHLVTAGTKPSEKGDANEFVVTGWELATGAKKGALTEPAVFGTPHVATAPDNQTAVVVTPKGQLVAFNIATGEKGKAYDLRRRMPGGAPVFSPDGKRLAVVCQSDFGPNPTAPVLVLDWPGGEIRHTFASPGVTPQAVAFSPDGKWLVTGSPDSTATVWDLSK
jgi:WD40 repeat protein